MSPTPRTPLSSTKHKNRFQTCFFHVFPYQLVSKNISWTDTRLYERKVLKPMSLHVLPHIMSARQLRSTRLKFGVCKKHRNCRKTIQVQIVANSCRTLSQLCFAASLAVESLRDTWCNRFNTVFVLQVPADISWMRLRLSRPAQTQALLIA